MHRVAYNNCPVLDHLIELISDQPALTAIAERIASAPALALDIETINWWDRVAEQVALIQLAFREPERPHVAIIDVLAGLDLEPLRRPLEQSLAPKAIHNASYDAVRLARYFSIRPSPIYDTMLAARRSGERRWSLKAQVEEHLGLQLDKSEQRSDWGRRPLLDAQLSYAAMDATCTLLLYERQVARGLRGDYELRQSQQSLLPLNQTPLPKPPTLTHSQSDTDLSISSLALLGIVAELGGRYNPEQLAASVGSDRVGLAGWIVDRAVGCEADIDEGTAQQEIARLSEEGLISLNATRRLEATARGVELWCSRKPETVENRL